MGPWGSSHMAFTVRKHREMKTGAPMTSPSLQPMHRCCPHPRLFFPVPLNLSGNTSQTQERLVCKVTNPFKFTVIPTVWHLRALSDCLCSYAWHLHPHPSACSAKEKPVPVPSPSKQSGNKLALQGSVHQTPRNTDRTLRTKESSCKKYQLRQMIFTDVSIAVQLWSCWCPRL